MPELPEVETVRLQLLHKILGKTIAKVEVFNEKTTNHDKRFAKTLKNKSIKTIDRIGKLLIFSFTGEEDLFVLTHLKMTGQFFFRDKTNVSGGGHSMTASDSKNLPNKHTRIAFTFTDNTRLYFNDMRLFGYMKIASAAETAVARAHFGPEPIADDFDTELFANTVRARKTSIKAMLLDQTFVAGLGNIYVDEALFMARVSPQRRSHTLTKKEALAVAASSRTVLQKAVKAGGTTFQHFLDTGGEKGNFSDYLHVFGRQNTPCVRCKTTIKKIKVAGRGTHFCPQCQK